MLPDRSQTAAPQGSAALVLGKGKRKIDYGLELNRHSECAKAPKKRGRRAD